MPLPPAELPYKLDPAATDDDSAPQWESSCELAHCHAISGPLLPLSAMSARCRGGGSGGGTGSLEFGIDKGLGIVAGDETEL
jgi:hypothetical protein